MTLSIIIVSYQCKEKLRVTLDAVFASKLSFDYEVILFDNASTDGTIEMVEEDYLKKSDIAVNLKFLKSETNEGFSKGNNLGINLAKGEYVLLLNPDTKVAPETLQVMMDFMKSEDAVSKRVGIATCKLVKGNGDLDWACRRSFPDPWVSFFRLSGLSKLFPNNRKISAYNLTYKSIEEQTEIDSCVGAFMFISPECMRAVKGFDEDFYMYGEDLDMCYRAKQAGFKVWYYPKTTTVHYKGQSSKKAPKQSLYAFHDAMWIFYKKHLYFKYPRVLSLAVWLGIWARYTIKMLQNWFRVEKIVSR